MDSLLKDSLAQPLQDTGGELTLQERAWADQALGITAAYPA